MHPSVSITMNWYFLIKRFSNLYNHSKFCITCLISHSLNCSNFASLSPSIIVLINGEPYTGYFFNLTFQRLLPGRSVLSECFAVSRYTCRYRRSTLSFLHQFARNWQLLNRIKCRSSYTEFHPNRIILVGISFLPEIMLVDFYCKYVYKLECLNKMFISPPPPGWYQLIP
jgi:hypothetical protein